MTELKTRKTDSSVEHFIANIADEERRSDCITVLRMMRKIKGCEPKMWGAAIVGFGDYHYVYDSGREGDWFLCGFSPRKQNLTLYHMAAYDAYPLLMKQLGKHKTGQSCLYINKLADVDINVPETLISESVNRIKNNKREQ